jgi:hypothetical protein
MAQPAAPKMDFKMFVMPAMLILSRQISFTVPNPDYPIGCEGDACPDIKVTPKEINVRKFYHLLQNVHVFR